MPPPATAPRVPVRRRVVRRCVAAAACLDVAAGALVLAHGSAFAGPSIDRTAVGSPSIDALFAARTAALAHGDPAAFAATATRTLRSDERAVAQRALAAPIAPPTFRVVRVDAATGSTGSSERVVHVDERWSVHGAQTGTASVSRTVTVIRQNGQWLVAADPPRDPWDFAPLSVVRSGGVLVIGHPHSPVSLGAVAAEARRDVPRVAAVWGSAPAAPVTVIVPASVAEADALAGTDMATLAAATVSPDPRVVIDPVGYRRLSAVGRRVVVTHELTHVATDSASGSAMPRWLDEGFADYVGWRGLVTSVRAAAPELAAQVAAGGVPARLPADAAFAAGAADAPAAYEEAWLACRTIARHWGQAALVRFYRAVGSGQAVGDAFARVLHTTPAAFTAVWRHDMAAELS